MDSSCIGGNYLEEYSFRLVMRRSVETNSSSLKADAWHHRSDAITSVAAFIGISVALLLGKDMSLQMIGQHSLLQDLSCLMLILFSDRTW
jgi:divalent metal cation (Fe/Co/Zn/Cd) transporter